MTTGTTSTIITSPFLTQIQQWIAQVENFAAQLSSQTAACKPNTANPSTGVLVAGIGSTYKNQAIQMVQNYVTFLQTNSQYTSLNDFTNYMNLTDDNPQLSLAISQVMDSAHQLQTQEMIRLVRSNPTLQYQAGSILYQAAYNLSTRAIQNNRDTTSDPSWYELFTINEAFHATTSLYVYITTFVQNYAMTSQINSLYQNMLNDYANPFMPNPSLLTTMSTMLMQMLQNLNQLQSSANAQTGNQVASSNIIGGSVQNDNGHMNLWIMIGGGAAVLVALYFIFGKNSAPVIVVPERGSSSYNSRY